MLLHSHLLVVSTTGILRLLVYTMSCYISRYIRCKTYYSLSDYIELDQYLTSIYRHNDTISPFRAVNDIALYIVKE